MLTDGETEDMFGAGKLEAVDGDIVRDDSLFLEFKVLKDIGLENLLNLEVVKVVGAKDQSQSDRVESPLLFDDESADD